MTALPCPPPTTTLNGSWAFRFEEGKALEDAFDPRFEATGTMVVPGCFDMMPQWYMKRGTGLYRRVFTLDAPLSRAVLAMDGAGVRVRFALDGRDLGLHATPYARLEIDAGPLDAGEHVLFAAVDNTLAWPRVKLARPYYDFYFYGGFYHGVSIGEKRPKLLVRTLDHASGTVEIEVDGTEARDFGATLLFDGANKVSAAFRDGRAAVSVPGFRLWSPEEPNLHTVSLAAAGAGDGPVASARFGIRRVEAADGRILLNGKPVFLKGFNRHESDWTNGAATGEALMLQDIQRLKALGGNFFRGAHYQQCGRFLDLCDENGVLVWEESLGWGNGQPYVNGDFPPNELRDPEFRLMQVRQTRDMVRASLNHPCVIVSAFLNECQSGDPDCKTLVDELVAAIRAERTGHLVTFACNVAERDICNENTDIVSINAYPGTIPLEPGTEADLAKTVRDCFDGTVAFFRKRYPGKPVVVSESGCGAVPGMRGEYASPATEEFQEEYLRDILETLWANPAVCGYAIWQMNDGRTRERFGGKAVSPMFGGSVAGVFDRQRRPKLSARTVKDFFSRK